MRFVCRYGCYLTTALALLCAAHSVIAQAPSITNIAPAVGSPGDSVIINGTNFGGPAAASSVKFGSAPGTVVTWTAAAITVIIPDVAAGSTNAVVSVAAGTASQSFDVVIPAVPITVTPQLIQPVNGKLPATVNIAVLESKCDDKNGTDLTQGTSAPYSLMVTGSGLTPSSQVNATRCTIVSTLTVDPNAPAGSQKVILLDKAKNPVGSADLTVLDTAAGPIPPGLAPEVDVMWGVMSQQNCSDAFGRRVAASLYCIQVKIGNNSGHPIQIAGVGFLKQLDPLLGLGSQVITIANSSYGSTRAVLVHAQSVSARNVIYSALQGGGLIMAASSPFIGKTATSHFLGLNTIVNGPLLAAYNLIFPDPILSQLTNLDDQSFRDNMVIANNSHVQTIVFVEKLALTQALEELAAKLNVAAINLAQQNEKSTPNGTSGASSNQQESINLLNQVKKASSDTIANSKRPKFSLFAATQSPLLVKLALGDFVIVGDEIEYLQRVQIQSNAASAPASNPLSASPSSLSFSSQNGVTNGASQAITLTNSGSSPVTNITPSIANTTDFTIQTNGSSPCSSTLAAGSTCKVFLAYTPSINPGSSGSRTATLQVSSSPGSSPLAIGLAGSASSTVYFSTTALAFGTATPAAPITAKVTIINFESTGLANLVFPAITGTNAAEFAISVNSCVGGSLASAASCTVTAKFTPAAIGAGTRTATLTVNYQLNGVAVTQTINLSGAS